MASIAHLFFRKMTIADVDNVHEIEQKAHYHPWSKTLITDAVSSYQCWLLFNNQQLVGYGIVKIIVGEAELLNITIDPLQQNNGLGKCLLGHLMKEAANLGAMECFLEVRESNLNAYRLYENYGFNEVGRRTNYYPTPKGHEDALIMACLLEPNLF